MSLHENNIIHGFLTPGFIWLRTSKNEILNLKILNFGFLIPILFMVGFNELNLHIKPKKITIFAFIGVLAQLV